MAREAWKRSGHSVGEGGQSRAHLVTRADGTDSIEYVEKRLKNRERVGRFRQEAEIGLKLSNHPNVVRVVDYDLDTEKPYIVTEYCAGGDLTKHTFPIDGSREAVLQGLRLFRQIVDGVAHAHKHGVIHRDLKPANIFLREDLLTPVVGDFGLCLVTDPSDGERHTIHGEVVGPRGFLAPEVEAGREEITPAADVYSLGKVLFWLLTGRVLPRELHRDEQHRIGQHDVGRLLGSRARPINPHLQLVNELFDQTITNNLNDRLQSAHQLSVAVDILVGRIQLNAHVVDIEAPQHCSFCGLGFYRLISNVSFDRWPTQGDQLRREVGLGSESQNAWLAMNCDRCGHISAFRPRGEMVDVWQRKPRS